MRWLRPWIRGTAFQHLENQGDDHICGITGLKKASCKGEYRVRVEWEGLDDEESKCEPVSRAFVDSPAILRKELRKNRPEAKPLRALNPRYPELCL